MLGNFHPQSLLFFPLLFCMDLTPEISPSRRREGQRGLGSGWRKRRELYGFKPQAHHGRGAGEGE